MKTFYLTFILSILVFIAKAQNKIVISYDQNGNRIKRERICPGCRPAPVVQDIWQTTGPVSGIGNLENSEDKSTAGLFQVYPNPAEHKVNVCLDANSLSKACSMILVDVTGKTLYQKQVITERVSSINLNGYADGTYYIILIRDNVKNTIKIVKQSGSGYN